MKTHQRKELPTQMSSELRFGPELNKPIMKFASSDRVTEDILAQLRREFGNGLNDILTSAKLLESHETEITRDHIQGILVRTRELLDLIEQKPNSQAIDSAGQNRPTQSTAAQCDVLYVEDNDANYCLVRRILERLPNVSLNRAERGEIAAPLARQCYPRLILLDLNLPDIPGTEVFARMRAQPETCSTPIVVISADATPTQIERLLAMGARNYLTKPFNVQRFLTVVQEILKEEATVS